MLDRFDEFDGWDGPLFGQGLNYSKSWIYVAAMLVESEMKTEDVNKGLGELFRRRLGQFDVNSRRGFLTSWEGGTV